MNEEQFKALSEDQRKALQRELQAKGLYPADARIDGVWGPATGAAFQLQETRMAEREAAARQDALEQERLAIERTKAQSQAQQTEAEAGRLAAETEARNRYNEQSSSNLGLATSVGANVAAPLVGVATGRAMGAGINALMDRSQENKNRVLAAAAEDRLKGVTTRKGAQSGTTVAGAMPARNSVLRVGGRMLPHAITGAGMAAKGAAMLSQGNEDDPYYTQMANRAAGLGMIGTGVGIAERGANYAVSPGVSPDAKSIAIIESEGLRRNNAPPEPKGPTPGTLAALKQEARDLNISGRSKLTTKSALQSAIDAAKKGAKSGVLGPLAAGALAYGATRNQAQAADGTGGGQGQALTNAAGAAGMTALAQRYAPRVMGALSRMSGPMALSEGAADIGRRMDQPGASVGSVASDLYQEGFGRANEDFANALQAFVELMGSGQGPSQAAGPYTP